MVQRKQPTTKLTPNKTKTKTKTKTKQGFDRHESPITVTRAPLVSSSMKLLPNYMKPTSSSDARKDELHVTRRSNCKSGPSSSSSSYSIITNSSRKSNNCSPPSVTSQRKLPITPTLKRSKSKVVFTKLNLNRATCSSTLKDSKFPKALDLNPGGTELEGTSVSRVCPYNYCSLNGHVHDPVPPLKSFLASKRKLIKSQQSMKLKGFSPFRKREPKRSEKEVSPLIQEVVNDFIVEIYATQNENIILGPAKIEERNSSESEKNERGEEEIVSTGLKSDSSVQEMDDTVKFVEYVSCDQEQGVITVKFSDLQEEEEEGEEEEEKNPVGADEDSTKFERFKEFDFVYMEDLDVSSDTESLSSNFTDGRSDRSLDQSVHNTKGGIHNQTVVNSAKEEGDEEVKISDLMVNTEQSVNRAESESVYETKEEDVSEIKPFKCTESESVPEMKEEIETSNLSECKAPTEISGNVSKDSKMQEIEGTDSSDKIDVREIVELGSQNKEEPDLNQSNEEIVDKNGSSEIDDLCVSFGDMRMEGEDYSFNPTSCQQKNRLVIARRRPRRDDDGEYMRGFNPRGPRFLPVEPDPESEKVDLKHQMMDERKNAEEWMIDHALQKVVNQLAPERKKKVELLVTAFETVAPVVPARGGGVTCS